MLAYPLIFIRFVTNMYSSSLINARSAFVTTSNAVEVNDAADFPVLYTAALYGIALLAEGIEDKGVEWGLSSGLVRGLSLARNFATASFALAILSTELELR